MSKEEFKKLYFGMTNKALADKLKISLTTARSYAKKLGYNKGSGNRTSKPKITIV